MIKKTQILLAFCLYGMLVFGQIPKYEVRAVWLTTLNGLDWPTIKATSPESIERQKNQLCAILDRLQSSNVNTILLQTRVRGTTIYPSRIEPFDGCLTGKPGRNPGYDPLEYAISECHRRGMELHAWVVALPIGKWNNLGCKNLRESHPSLVHKIGDEGFMNPERDGTGDYISRICQEIIENYDVDGIHLDYIRYPENWKLRVSKLQGRENITSIVRKIHKTIKDRKPWVKLSSSPIGKFCSLPRHPSDGWNAYDKVCQDAQGWLREGIMDQLYPMMYFKGDNFYPFAIDWSDYSYGRTVAPGLGIWLLSRKEGSNWSLMDITRELNVLRSMGMGHTYFRSRFFTDDTKGIYNYVKSQFDMYPSLIPPMTWQSSVLPNSPEGIDVKSSGNKTYLRWWGGKDNSDAHDLLYNVYASTTTPVDTSDPRNLIAMRQRTPNICIEGAKGDHYYAITSIDRYGNESKALQSKSTDRMHLDLLKNDGRQLVIPSIPSSIECKYLCIKSLAGQTIKTVAITGDHVNIRTLPEGVYTLNALDNHKTPRRIGQFIIKR